MLIGVVVLVWCCAALHSVPSEFKAIHLSVLYLVSSSLPSTCSQFGVSLRIVHFSMPSCVIISPLFLLSFFLTYIIFLLLLSSSLFLLFPLLSSLFSLTHHILYLLSSSLSINCSAHPPLGLRMDGLKHCPLVRSLWRLKDGGSVDGWMK